MARVPSAAVRFAFEAAFLVLVALGAGLARLDPVVIVALMAVAWVLVALVERASAREAARAAEASGDGAEAAEREPPPHVEVVQPERGDSRPELEPEAEPEPELAVSERSARAILASGPPPLPGSRPPEPEPAPEPRADAGVEETPGSEAGADAEPPAEPQPEPEPQREEPEPEPVEPEPEPVEPDPERQPEPQPEPEPEPVREPEPVYSGPPREWNVWELERLVRERPSDPRHEERAALVLSLRDFARADGALPLEFDDLVRESFGALLTAPDLTAEPAATP